MIKILLNKNMYNKVYKSRYKYNYRYYYCDSYERKLEEKIILNGLNSPDKEKLNLYYSLSKIQLQNEKLIETIKILDNKIEKIISEKKNNKAL